MAEFFPSFSPLASRYDAFILDIWGVIHDGQKLYPDAAECLKKLREAGKKIVLLSNAPRRALVAAEGLLRMGVAVGAYDALITSGETAYQWLANSSVECHSRESGNPSEKVISRQTALLLDARLRGHDNNKYIYIGLERDRGILDGLPYQETDNPAEAHFLIIAHTFYDNQPMSELEPLLARCLKAGLPALCINPDTEVVRQNGERVYCAGVIAAEYAARGGQVIYFGKPHKIVYEACFKALSGIDPSRILAVGDNLATDIQGAAQTGLKCALVTGGILKEKLGEPGTKAYAKSCAALFEQAKAGPDYVIPAFKW